MEEAGGCIWASIPATGSWRPRALAYFRRFQQLLLDDLNREMTDKLKAADGGYDPIYRTLKTHLTISSGKCAVEPPLVSDVLKTVRDDIDAQRGADWQKLSDLQIEFYSKELAHGNPAPVPENSPAVAQGRHYLRKLGGVDRIYSAILSNARKNVAKAKGLAELAPTYAQVMRGPSEPPAGFVIEGWDFVVRESKDQKSALLGDCVFADGQDIETETDPKQQADLSPEIQRLYVRDYIRNWRDYLNGYSVVGFANIDDAVRKLELLSSNRSPLLALFAVTANQTNFPDDLLQTKVRGILQKVEKVAGIGTEAKTVLDISGTPAEITQFFQPVHLVVPPNGELWVTEKTAAYMDALARLRGALQKIAMSPDAGARAAASQEAIPIKERRSG
jgi:type VI protein secretion system component VasK